MKKINEYLTGKSIAIIGNAVSLLKNKDNIDNHDVLIRINRGSPKSKSNIGTRTDILVLSSLMTKNEVYEMFNPKFVIFMSPRNRDKIDEKLKKDIIFYPVNKWNILERKLNARPSTGCMIIDYIYFNIAYKNIYLYGFDFMETPTWYNGLRRMASHNYKNEKKYINNIVNNSSNIFLK